MTEDVAGHTVKGKKISARTLCKKVMSLVAATSRSVVFALFGTQGLGKMVLVTP